MVAAALLCAVLIAKVRARVLDAQSLRDSERFAVTPISARAASGPATTRTWDELSQEVQPYWTLRIVLPDGTTLQGTSARLVHQGLTMRVEKTAAKELHPKGVAFIPRKQIRALDVRTNQPVGRAVDRRFRHVQLVP